MSARLLRRRDSEGKEMVGRLFVGVVDTRGSCNATESVALLDLFVCWHVTSVASGVVFLGSQDRFTPRTSFGDLPPKPHAQARRENRVYPENSANSGTCCFIEGDWGVTLRPSLRMTFWLFLPGLPAR